MRADEAIYRFWLERRRARFLENAVRVRDCAVVSVGNLSVGGTGKTPFVQFLARGFQERGARVAVVSRGHGGTLSKTGALVSDGKTTFLGAHEAGDEPILHARSLPGVGVVIGANRVQAAQTAIRVLDCDTIVLDDGFGFWSLRRDLDIVLLDARAPLGDRHLMPRGRLREPPQALKRADILVLTRCERASEAQLAQSESVLRDLCEAPIFHARHVVLGLRDEANGARFPLENLRDVKVGALSAIADNAGFATSLRENGARVVSQKTARDHHAWRQSEVRNFARKARKSGARAIVTTEKDAVKVGADWYAPLPLWSLEIGIAVDEKDKLWAQIAAVRAKVRA